MTITCTKGAATTLGLGLGPNGFGSVRKMKGSGSNLLTYELYQPPNTTPGSACSFSSPTVWGNSGAGLFTPAAASTSGLVTISSESDETLTFQVAQLVLSLRFFGLVWPQESK